MTLSKHETLMTGISGKPEWFPCTVLEYGTWSRDFEGNPWQKVTVFIPPFKGSHVVASTKLRDKGA